MSAKFKDAYARFHWGALSVLAGITGFAFIFGGIVFSIWGISLVSDPKATLPVNGVPSSDPREKASVLIVGLVCCVLGVLLLKARRFFPGASGSPFTPKQKNPVAKREFP